MINVVLQRGSQRNKEEVDGVRVESNVFMLLGAKDESFGTYSAPVDGWNRDVRGDNDLPTATRGAMASLSSTCTPPQALPPDHHPALRLAWHGHHKRETQGSGEFIL